MNTCIIEDAAILDENRNYNQQRAYAIVDETTMTERKKAHTKTEIDNCISNNRDEKLVGPMLICVGNAIQKICD